MASGSTACEDATAAASGTPNERDVASVEEATEGSPIVIEVRAFRDTEEGEQADRRGLSPLTQTPRERASIPAANSRTPPASPMAATERAPASTSRPLYSPTPSTLWHTTTPLVAVRPCLHLLPFLLRVVP